MEWNLYKNEYSSTPLDNNPLHFTVRTKDCRTSWVIWIEDRKGFRISPKRIMAKPIDLDAVFKGAEEILLKYVQLYENRIEYSLDSRSQ